MSKAAANTGSIRQRPDGRWEARYTIPAELSPSGAKERKSIYGDTQAEVSKKLRAIVSDLDRGIYQEPNKITVKEWFDIWLETFARTKVKPLTFQSYQGIINRHILPAIGKAPLQSVKGVHIQRMYNGLTAQGLSAKTVKNVAAVAHKAFSVALKQGYISLNPCGLAELPKAQQHEIKPLTDAEIPLFLAAIESDPFCNVYALCLFAGLREAEALGLSWGQVDFKAGRITINQQLQKNKTGSRDYFIAKSTKSGKVRIVEPPAICFQYLRNEKARQSAHKLAAGPVWSNPDNLVFTDATGKHLAFFTFYNHFKKIAAGIGRPDARPHDLRHTAATVALAQGATLKSVQDMLGHSTASFTLNVYAHTTDEMRHDTASRVQDYYDSLQEKA